MGYFPEVRAAALRGARVMATPLVHFDWQPTPSRYHLGFGSLVAGGHTWTGLAELGGISGIESAIGGTAPEVTFTLSGVKPEHVAAALDASDDVTGQSVTVSLQFFDENWQTLDTPYAIYSGIMDVMRIRSADASSRIIEVTAETLFVRRAAPPWAWLTDKDQQRRYPGDRGLEFVPTMASKNPIWPQFD